MKGTFENATNMFFKERKLKPSSRIALLLLALCLMWVNTASSIGFGVGGGAYFSRQIRLGNWDYINPIFDYMSDSNIKSTRVGFPCTRFLSSTHPVDEYLENFHIFLDMCDSKGIDVTLMLGYGSGPHYLNLYEITGCSTDPPDSSIRVKFPPVDDAWETYVEGMIDEFGSQISGIEVWNEPDHIEHLFCGRVEDYIHLFLIAEEIVKERFPSLPVATAGLTCGRPIYRSYMKALLNPVTGIYNKCDAFGLHAYTGRALEILRNYEEACEEIGVEPKPVWMTEFGRRLDEELPKTFCSINGARAYPEHVMEIFSSHGVERAFWFCATCESDHGGIGNHSLFDWDEDNRTITPNDKWNFYTAAAEKHENYGIGDSIGFGSVGGQDLFGISPFENYLEDPNSPEKESAFRFVDENDEYPIRSRIVGSDVMAISFDLNDSWVDEIFTDQLLVEVDILSYGDGAEVELRYQSCCETGFLETNVSTANYDSLECPAFLDGLTVISTSPDYIRGVDYDENVNIETLSFSPGTLTTVSVQIDDWMFQNGLARRSDITFVPANANVDSFEIHRIEIHPVTTQPPLYTVEYTDKSSETQLQYSGQPRNAMSLNYDNDEFKDLFVTRFGDNGMANKSLRYSPNGVPEFDDMTTWVLPSGNEVAPGANGIVAADFDNDGWIDFFATNPNETGRLYRNINGEYFEDWTIESGLSTLLGNDGEVLSCSWADYDGDGYLDLTVVKGDESALQCGQGVLEVYRNNGGIFESTEITCSSGFSPLWADFDNDGDLDLMTLQSHPEPVGDPPFGYSNYFFINQGDGSFVDDAWARIGATNNMSGFTICAVVDFDNDGDLDVVFAGYSSILSLLENNHTGNPGLGYFSTCSPFDSFESVGNPTDIAVLDYDLDGYQDVIVGFGSLFDGSGPSSVHLFGNRLVAGSQRHFVDDTTLAGLTGTSSFVGIAPADYNRDGFPDIYLTRASNQAFFYKAKPIATEAQNNWVGLTLQSPAGANNTSGIGARVVVTAGSNTYTQTVDGGSGLASQHESDLVFGLGNYVGWVSVQIAWPSGHTQVVSNLATRQYHTLVDASPVIDNSSINLQKVYHLNTGRSDWVFTWTTFNNSTIALDKVVFDLSNVPGRCPPVICHFILISFSKFKYPAILRFCPPFLSL